MARKNKDGAAGSLDNESKGSKAVTALIAIIIILIWLAVFAFLIKLDIGGIGSNVLYPVLKDVPVVNKILPEASEEQQASEGNYKYNTLKSANARIKELERRLESETGTTTANSDYIAEMEAEIRKLRRYKNEQDAFAKRVLEFDEKVVFTDNAPDINEYRAYYEQIAPENAERIYRQVLDRLQSSERAKELATLYAGMEPAAAAQMITNLNEELDLVCDILRNMKESNASAIMQELDSTYAAQITKKISTLGSN
jgi:flagellar motility protein MotE (MotC chaperone)